MNEEKKPVDVTDTTKTDPIIPLAAGVGSGGDLTSFIEGQERAGQAEVVRSTVLPYPSNGDDEPYIALGFTFGEKRDELFREATLPEGWSREGSDHAMWSYILDADGYRRVAIFYKAAFYDRRADMHIERLPRTTAQADAWEKVDEITKSDGYDGYDEPFWSSGEDRRDGPNYVYAYKGCLGKNLAQSKKVCYPHGGPNAFAEDGRRLEIEVAPDGTIIAQRESMAWSDDA